MMSSMRAMGVSTSSRTLTAPGPATGTSPSRATTMWCPWAMSNDGPSRPSPVMWSTGYLRGRGASDMKAGLAGTMFAIAVLHELRVPFLGRLSFAGVCEEEAGGDAGTPTVLRQGHLEGVTGAVIAEPSERAHPTIGQKGSNKFRMTIDGVPGHGSLQPLHGTNANLLAARAIVALQRLWDMTPTVADPELRALIEDSKLYAEEREGYAPGISQVFEHVTINIGTVSGGTSVNVVADRAGFEIDTRVPIG
jgi:succinyl-diaminopimelate desuccinylase